MPQKKRRVPNASGGNPPLAFRIYDELLAELKEIGYTISNDLSRELTDVTNLFLWRASLELNSEPEEKALDRNRQVLMAVARCRDTISAPSTGDADDFANIGAERHFYHPLIPEDSDEGKLAIVASILTALESACSRSREEISSQDAGGHRFGQSWDRWIVALTAHLERQGLPTSARKDDDKRSADQHSQFVRLVHAFQKRFAEEHRRGAHSLSALANAIYRARASGQE